MEIKIKLRLPEDFKYCKETIMSNFNHTIDKKIAKSIKNKKLVAQYAGWNFCGWVWWQANQWNCEIWRYHSYIETINANTLEEIMDEVCETYGND